ncbi:hypothetical protein, partial [Sphingobium chlorophenolicum]|uniref:hypothetical protein n=1 Tax=Sphingobium chlorophenolicum TaxID=46429 RepID=UPI001C3FDAAB
MAVPKAVVNPCFLRLSLRNRPNSHDGFTSCLEGFAEWRHILFSDRTDSFGGSLLSKIAGLCRAAATNVGEPAVAFSRASTVELSTAGYGGLHFEPSV